MQSLGFSVGLSVLGLIIFFLTFFREYPTVIKIAAAVYYIASIIGFYFVKLIPKEDE